MNSPEFTPDKSERGKTTSRSPVTEPLPGAASIITALTDDLQEKIAKADEANLVSIPFEEIKTAAALLVERLPGKTAGELKQLTESLQLVAEVVEGYSLRRQELDKERSKIAEAIFERTTGVASLASVVEDNAPLDERVRNKVIDKIVTEASRLSEEGEYNALQLCSTLSMTISDCASEVSDSTAKQKLLEMKDDVDDFQQSLKKHLEEGSRLRTSYENVATSISKLISGDDPR